VPSWDCDGGTCFDPGNGQGVYSTLQDCQYNCTNVLIEDFGLTNFKIYPNPSDNLFNIEFVSNRLQNLNIKVLNVLGEDVFVEYLDQFSGKYVQQVNLSNKAKGIYLLEIETNQGLINKKLILQ
tara:strand:- start:293 stop:664 length:372 start_codon:yes stop_codon:yes gene_type:complete